MTKLIIPADIGFSKVTLILTLLICFSTPLAAAKPTVQLLWPEGAPDAKGKTDNDKPSLTIYHAKGDTATGTAVVVCPGGGYGHLAMGHEGHDIAKWFNSMGVSAFILKYRHRNMGYGHPTPMNDAKRAMRLVRSNAKKWKIKPEQIGIMGFSAGGHLASTIATHFDSGKADSKDVVEQVSCRPDFAILCYPVITMGKHTSTHGGSKRNLLGKNPDKKLVELLSNEKQVTSKTPPTFLMHTNADKGVPAENSVLFYLALRKAKVPAELHIYEKGRHGLGLAKNTSGVSEWPKQCRKWMSGRGLLKK